MTHFMPIAEYENELLAIRSRQDDFVSAVPVGAQPRETQGESVNMANRVGMDNVGVDFDTDIYSGSGKTGKYDGYHTSLAFNDEAEDEETPGLAAAAAGGAGKAKVNYSAPKALVDEARRAGAEDDVDPFENTRRRTIADREDDYRKKRMNAKISPLRVDPFANGGATPDVHSRRYFLTRFLVFFVLC